MPRFLSASVRSRAFARLAVRPALRRAGAGGVRAPSARRAGWRLVGLLPLLVIGFAACGDATTAPTVSETPRAGGVTVGLVVGGAEAADTLDVGMGATLPTIAAVVHRGAAPLAGVPVTLRLGSTRLMARTDARGVAIWSASDALIAPAAEAMLTIGELVVEVTAAPPTGSSAGTAAASPAITATRRVVVRAWRDLRRGPATTGDAPGDAPLVVPPVALASVAFIDALGALDARVGAVPLATSRWHLQASARAEPVRSPATAVVLAVDAAAGRVALRVHDALVVALDGVRPTATLHVGRTVRVGEVLGTVTDDLLGVRVLDARQRAGAATDAAAASTGATSAPARLGALRHARFLAALFPTAARDGIYGLVRRAAPDLEGRVHYDRADRLVGTWYDAAAPTAAVVGVTDARDALGLPVAFGPAYDQAAVLAALAPERPLGAHALTFAYDVHTPGQVRIALGASLAAALGAARDAGVYGVAWEDADPGLVALLGRDGQGGTVGAPLASAARLYSLHAEDDVDRARSPVAVLLLRSDARDGALRVSRHADRAAAERAMARLASGLSASAAEVVLTR